MSLDGSRVYTIVNDASLNGVVFNCLPVKVNFTDGVVLDILPFLFLEKIKEKIDNSDKHTLPMNQKEKRRNNLWGVGSEIETKICLIS